MENDKLTNKSKIHGGAAKLGRIHFWLLDLRNNRRKKLWGEVYSYLEDLYLEIEAYQDEKERKELDKLWLELNGEMEKEYRNIRNNSVPFITLELEKRIRRIIKAKNMDMGLQEKQKNAGRAFTDEGEEEYDED